MKFSTLLQHITPQRFTLALIIALLLLGSGISLLNPWIAGQLAQAVITPVHALYPIRALLIGWLGLMVVRSILSFCTQYLIGVTGQKMSAQLRNKLYEHLQVMPMSFYQDRRAGDLLTMLANDSALISGFVTNTVVQLLPQLFVFFGAILMMAWLDYVIALLALVLMPIYYIAIKLVGRRIRPITAQWIKAWSSMVAMVAENLNLMPIIKAFVREPHEENRFQQCNEAVLVQSRKQILQQALLSPSIALLAGAGLLLLLWVGLGHMESGQITASTLVSLLLYAMLLNQPISGLANVYGQVLLTRGAAERLLDFLSSNPETQGVESNELKITHGEIRFENINFSYPGRQQLIKDFNLTISAGEIIALTGPNGIGKTTLALLLLRFIEPDSGQILIDDTDISTVDLASLRRQIGLVAQKTLLLNGTIKDNISYGLPSASMTEIKKAAKAAQASKFIENLPDQYETLIGDQGMKLSGGQRQRLSLARTLLRDPAILILDEATAMFDPQGETSFIDSCKELLEKRTVILITHRPASLALADRVIQMAEINCEQTSGGIP